MGCCASKNCPSRPPQSAAIADVCSATPPQTLQVQNPTKSPQTNKENGTKKEILKEEECKNVKKDVFVMEHRGSYEKRKSFEQKSRNSTLSADEASAEVSDTTPANSVTASNDKDACLNSSVRVRTSSFTKEEVDAILIQCGKLSRSNSTNKATPSSGKKRGLNSEDSNDYGDDEEKRHRRRQSRSGSQERRRRTPSREKERSNSRERVSSSGRRVSRSPGRRNGAAAQVNCNASCSSNDTNGKPGKMVSVPATVTSVVADKGNNPSDGLESANRAAIKRIRAKRNASEAAGSRGAASPRAVSPAKGHNKAPGENQARAMSPARGHNKALSENQARAISPARKHIKASSENQARAISPARGHIKASSENQARAMSPARRHIKVSCENQARGAASPRAMSPARGNQQQQPPLNRSSSRKEQSPYRRNALGEIDQNLLVHPQMLANQNTQNRRKQSRSRDFDEGVHMKEPANYVNQKPNVDMNKENTNYKNSRKETIDSRPMNKIGTEKELQESTEEAGRQSPLSADDTVICAAFGSESLKPQTLKRSRSSRQSKDLDFNPETWEKPTSSYTALLLEDIQNFHQKTNNNGASLPPCVTKARSIVEAVADLTSTTNSSVEWKRPQINQHL